MEGEESVARFLANVPEWLRQLQVDPTGVELKIKWIAPENLEAAQPALYNLLNGYEAEFSQAQVQLADQDLSFSLLVGSGGAGLAEGSSVGGARLQFWVDTRQPDQLKCALNELYPPFLWIPAGQTIAEIRQNLSFYFPATTPAPPDPGSGLAAAHAMRQPYKRPHFPVDWKMTRLMLGVLPADQFTALENRALFLPFSKQYLTALGTAPASEDNLVQLTAYHTANTGAEIVLQNNPWLEYDGREDLHGVGVVLTYPPAAHPELISRFNAAFGSDFPLDVPVDLVANLARFPMKGAERIRQQLALADDLNDILNLLDLLSITEPDQARLEADLRSFAGHPNVKIRFEVVLAAQVNHLTGLLHEREAVETTPKIREYIANVLLKMVETGSDG